MSGTVSEHITAPPTVLAGDDDPGFVRVLARGRGWVEGDDDTGELRHALVGRPAQFFQARAVPQCARHIVENFAIDLLPAEPCSFVFPDNLREERVGEVGTVLIARPSSDERRRVGEQLADDLDRLRRGGDDDARIRPKPQPEHQHVPRLWIPPGGYFITPRCIVLRPSVSVARPGYRPRHCTFRTLLYGFGENSM